MSTARSPWGANGTPPVRVQGPWGPVLFAVVLGLAGAAALFLSLST